MWTVVTAKHEMQSVKRTVKKGTHHEDSAATKHVDDQHADKDSGALPASSSATRPSFVRFDFRSGTLECCDSSGSTTFALGSLSDHEDKRELG